MKKILFLLGAVLTLSSCLEDSEDTSVLTQSQKNEIASQNPDKVFSSDLAGMYSNLQSYVYSDMDHNYFGQKGFDFLTSLMGNDMVLPGAYAMIYFHYLIEYRQQEYTATYNRWYEGYRYISDANNILGSIDPEDDNVTLQLYRAQALAFRGMGYLHLTHLYQYAYKVGVEYSQWGLAATHPDNADRLCVPIITETITGQQPRATVAEVYNQLLGDLEAAYAIYQKLGKIKTSDPTDIDGCVVANYLMRAYMVKQDWTNAEKYAKVITSNFGILTTVDEITQGFSSLALPDVVFGCDINSENSTIYMSWFSQMDAYGAGYGGVGVWRVGFKPFVDRIADTDIRLQWFCTSRTFMTLRDTNIKADMEYQSVKFIGLGRPAIQAAGANFVRGQAGWELGDYIYLRSEEAYLSLAEIYVHQNKISDAVAALNSFMKTRNPNYNCSLTDRAALLEEIIFQKRVEFWGEGMEFLDNRRLNIPVDRTVETWGDANNHIEDGQFKYAADDIHFLYQLPLSEVQNNKYIGDEFQNE